VRTAGCTLSVYDPCHLSGRIVIESMSLFSPNAKSRVVLKWSAYWGKPEVAGRRPKRRF
jgi:hypothetical protein